MKRFEKQELDRKDYAAIEFWAGVVRFIFFPVIWIVNKFKES